MAFIWDLLAKGLAAHPAPVAPLEPAITIGKATLTGGQVRALYEVASHLVTGAANVQDEESVAEVVIDAALTLVAPGVADLAIPAANMLADLLFEGIASGTIHGDPDPIHDAQINLGRGGRQG